MKHTLVCGTLLVLMSFGCGGGDDGGGAGSGGGPAAGSGGGGASCDPVAACGGELKGTWKSTKLCISNDAAMPDQLKQFCADATLSIGSTHIDGTITYKQDMSFTQNGTVGATIKVKLPASCVSGMKCSDFQAALQILGTTSCSDTSDKGCDCMVDYEEDSNANGTYSISGNTVTQTTDKESVSTDYCVKGSTMYLLPSTSGAAADSWINGQVVLDKQ